VSSLAGKLRIRGKKKRIRKGCRGVQEGWKTSAVARRRREGQKRKKRAICAKGGQISWRPTNGI